MIADNHVLIDSCVLANQAVADLLLRLSTHPRLILPHWTNDILDEVRRTHLNKLHWPIELADSFQNALKRVFPEALITEYEPFINIMPNHEKDRHVMAAAVKGRVDTLITFNVKDFLIPEAQLYGVEILHPQDLLQSLYMMHKEHVITRIKDIAMNKGTDVESVCLKLRTSIPKFFDLIIADIHPQKS